jgi:hypothetical protein
VNTVTFTQAGGTVGAGTFVTATGAQTLSGGTILGALDGAGAVTVQTGTTNVNGAGTIASTSVTVNSGTLSTDGGALAAAADVATAGTLNTTGAETIATLTQTGGTIGGGGAFTVTGTFAQSGGATLAAGTSVNAAGAQTLSGGTILGTLGGAGAVTVQTGTTAVNGAGTIAATSVGIAATGTLATDGGALAAAADVTNAGVLTLTGPESIRSLSGAGTTNVTGAGTTLTLNGGVSNVAGAINGSGGLTVAGSTATLTAANGYSGTTTVTGGSLSVTGAGTLASADIDILGGTFATDGGALAAGTVVTGPGAFALTGSESIASLNTAGTTTLTGAGTTLTLNTGASVIGGAIGGTGALTLAGTSVVTLNGANTFTGATTVAAGTRLILNGAIGGDLIVNSTTGAFGATIAGTGSDIAGVNTVGGSVTNAGTMGITGFTRVGGDFTNTVTAATGIVDMRGSGADDVLSIVGNLDGGEFIVDVSFPSLYADNPATAADDGLVTGVAGQPGLSDRVQVAGTVNTAGTPVGFTLNPLADLARAGDRVVLLTSSNTQDAFDAGTFVLRGVTGGALVTLLEVDGNNLLAVNQTSGGIGGLAANVSVVQSLVSNVVNRPTSPFTGGVQGEQGRVTGGYFRVTGGRADVTGTSNNGVRDNVAQIGASYWGAQAGYDVGFIDDDFLGDWDATFGALVGYNAGKTSQGVFLPGVGGDQLASTTFADFQQSYVGLYAAFNRGLLTVDTQLRGDRTTYDLRESVEAGFIGLGVAGQDFDSRSLNLTTRVSYGVRLNEAANLFLVPTGGFSLTRTGSSAVNVIDPVTGDPANAASGVLTLDSYTSNVLFLGATVVRTFPGADDNTSSRVFLSGNYYHDVDGNRTATFAPGNGDPAQNLTIEGIGGFGEASLGWNYITQYTSAASGRPVQLNANVRADVRFGDNVSDAYSLTAQLRLAF